MLRDGKFSQVTRDHSLLQEQIDSGIITAEQAKHAQHKNLVTKALGIDPDGGARDPANTPPSRATSTCSARTGCATWWTTRTWA